jgi:hypothetical protein
MRHYGGGAAESPAAELRVRRLRFRIAFQATTATDAAIAPNDPPRMRQAPSISRDGMSVAGFSIQGIATRSKLPRPAPTTAASARQRYPTRKPDTGQAAHSPMSARRSPDLLGRSP